MLSISKHLGGLAIRLAMRKSMAANFNYIPTLAERDPGSWPCPAESELKARRRNKGTMSDHEACQTRKRREAEASC
jgi:hypothetical protein